MGRVASRLLVTTATALVFILSGSTASFAVGTNSGCPTGGSAQGGGTSSLPWESPLCSIANSLSGPTAYGIALIGVFVAGAMLIFGGEINEFFRRLIMLILVISLLFAAATILAQFRTAGLMLN
jgi:type IV secretion system protein VirB2